MNGIATRMLDGTHHIHGLADHVHHAAECASADRNRDGAAHIFGGHAANHTVRRLHRHAPHAAFTKMLLHFRDDIERSGNIEARTGDAKRLVNRRLLSFREFHVHCGTDNLRDLSDV